jgi:membrane protein DedA with SNARE-associated domain
MVERVLELPLWWAVLTLFAIVFVRLQIVYWLSRMAGEKARTRSWGQRLQGPRMQRAERLLDRWGAPAVGLAVIVPGVQSAAHLLAGVGRMPYPRYLPAMAVGCLAWAVIYTSGLAAAWSWLGGSF